MSTPIKRQPPSMRRAVAASEALAASLAREKALRDALADVIEFAEALLPDYELVSYGSPIWHCRKNLRNAIDNAKALESQP